MSFDNMNLVTYAIGEFILITSILKIYRIRLTFSNFEMTYPTVA